MFSRLVEEKKLQLLSADPRLNELDAHRKAGALVAKSNPDLLEELPFRRETGVAKILQETAPYFSPW